jgi:hypothetical protein
VVGEAFWHLMSGTEGVPESLEDGLVAGDGGRRKHLGVGELDAYGADGANAAVRDELGEVDDGLFAGAIRIETEELVGHEDTAIVFIWIEVSTKLRMGLPPADELSQVGRPLNLARAAHSPAFGRKPPLMKGIEQRAVHLRVEELEPIAGEGYPSLGVVGLDGTGV